MLTYWLATTRADGRPHTAGVGAKWLDERLWFTSGPSRQKSRNLAANANCEQEYAPIGHSVAARSFRATWLAPAEP